MARELKLELRPSEGLSEDIFNPPRLGIVKELEGGLLLFSPKLPRVGILKLEAVSPEPRLLGIERGDAAFGEPRDFKDGVESVCVKNVF